MASYQSVVKINIIMKFLIGHKAFCLSVYTVSLCTTLPYISRNQHNFTNYSNALRVLYFVSSTIRRKKGVNYSVPCSERTLPTLFKRLTNLKFVLNFNQVGEEETNLRLSY